MVVLWFPFMIPWPQAVEAMQSAKIVDVLGPDFKEQGTGGSAVKGPRRSASKDRLRRESKDNIDSVVAYDKSGIPGQDEVSIGIEWAGDGVSTSTLQVNKHAHSISQSTLSLLFQLSFY